MGKRYSRTFVWHFDVPPERLWPSLADTARFNEAAGLPKHDIEEIPQDDGSVIYLGHVRLGPITLRWRDWPVNWVTGQWFEHRRDFSKGPLKKLNALLRFVPEGAGCRCEYHLEAEAANLLGHVILSTNFFTGAGKTFGRLAEDAGRFATGDLPMAFQFQPPVPDAETQARIDSIVTAIEDSGHGHGLAPKLAELVRSAQEVDLVHLRPIKLAREWEANERNVIELCLEAARTGLLALRWDVLCPRCRVPKASVASLDELPRGAHCDTCNIDYDGDFSRNVELSFHPAPALRSISVGEYCLFGPMSTPHVVLQLTLEPGETREEPIDLTAGRYRLRSLEPGPELDIDLEEGKAFPALVADTEGFKTADSDRKGCMTLSNQGHRPLTLILEERPWVRDALTADRVTAMQAFRDLFSDQVLRPGDEVEIKRVCLLFSDLQGSTALYGAIGDARAYHLVRDHFAFLAAIVRANNGAVVKTIGDAIMAAFADPADTVRAALAIQNQVESFNAGRPDEGIVIKLGIHEGPSIAVTLNGRLDYFGSTVNMAARLQGTSQGGDVVISKSLAADPAVGPLLEPLDCRIETTLLKGFDEPVEFLRLSPQSTATYPA
ncbi:adenylate/guanylate cyclase domain-containing protein [Pelagibius sp. Alg239-R121]|uniref:adenylate/guanylate cyclase domain-containing protein n=1 Tax=Pelagibius sp. Alg239-R121 TaxID=2993448 RepID=UPI0024A73F50|nr:adenylate/guanylate cyclase domain-containing protein [Pelagibius sp. Alg239-R121]